MEILKGWTRLKEEERPSIGGNNIMVLKTLPLNRRGVMIEIFESNDGGSFGVVCDSSRYKIEQYRTLQEAKEFAFRIMKHINHGRYKVKVFSREYFYNP